MNDRSVRFLPTICLPMIADNRQLVNREGSGQELANETDAGALTPI